jgi:hypothetical protein
MRQGTTFALVPLIGLGILLSPALAGSSDDSKSWSLPDESQGTRVAPLFLLSRPEIREDLGLTPALSQQVEKEINDLFTEAAKIKGKTGTEAIAQRKKVDESQKAWLENNLAPDQVDRLAQIDLRWEGPAAIVTRPSVASPLSLSDEQKAALKRAMAERNAQREKAKDHHAADQQFTQRVMSILTEGQKQSWERMLGRPIALKTAAAPHQSPR